MIRDIFVVGSFAAFSTMVFSLIIGFSLVLLPIPFLALIIPICLAGQLVYAMFLNEIIDWFGYRFKK